MRLTIHRRYHSQFPYHQVLQIFFKTNSLTQPTLIRSPLRDSPYIAWEVFVFQICSLPGSIATTWQPSDKQSYCAEFLKALSLAFTPSATSSSKEIWLYLKTFPIWSRVFSRFLLSFIVRLRRILIWKIKKMQKMALLKAILNRKDTKIEFWSRWEKKRRKMKRKKVERC